MPQPRKSTEAQAARVLELERLGFSIRAIAAEVFGDRRYRGRVERLLYPRPRPPARSREELSALVRALMFGSGSGRKAEPDRPGGVEGEAANGPRHGRSLAPAANPASRPKGPAFGDGRS